MHVTSTCTWHIARQTFQHDHVASCFADQCCHISRSESNFCGARYAEPGQGLQYDPRGCCQLLHCNTAPKAQRSPDQSPGSGPPLHQAVRPSDAGPLPSTPPLTPLAAGRSAYIKTALNRVLVTAACCAVLVCLAKLQAWQALLW